MLMDLTSGTPLADAPAVVLIDLSAHAVYLRLSDRTGDWYLVFDCDVMSNIYMLLIRYTARTLIPLMLATWCRKESSVTVTFLHKFTSSNVRKTDSRQNLTLILTLTLTSPQPKSNATRGVYPYLPLATNAPRTIGGFY